MVRLDAIRAIPAKRYARREQSGFEDRWEGVQVIEGYRFPTNAININMKEGQYNLPDKYDIVPSLNGLGVESIRYTEIVNNKKRKVNFEPHLMSWNIAVPNIYLASGINWEGIPRPIKEASLNVAEQDKSWALKTKDDAKWVSEASDESKRMLNDRLTKSVEQLASEHAQYWKLRAMSGHDLNADRTWRFTISPPKRLVKEIKDGYYYQFPDDGRYYVIRWLKDGGYHLFPEEDGELPRGMTKEEAEKNIWTSENAKIVGAKEASKYPVPKRW